MDPLYEALTTGNVAFIENYIRNGGDVNDFQYGDPYLFLAKDLPTMRCLVEAGANLEAASLFEEQTVLNYASMNGKKTIVYFLVENGAHIDTKDWAGWTPLHHVACDGNIDLVKYFVEKGAPLDAKNSRGQTPCDLATNKEVIEFLERWSIPDVK